MSKQAAIQAMIEASEREQTKPPAFLNAWKDAPNNGEQFASKRTLNLNRPEKCSKEQTEDDMYV